MLQAIVLAGVVVGGRDALLELAVEQRLAHRDRRRAAWRRCGHQRSTSASSASGAATRLTRPLAQRLVGADEVAGDEHLEGRLAREVARQRHARRRAEQAEVDAADREARVARGHRQVAHRHQLAAGRGGDALHARDHRHRQLLDRQHHAACIARTGARSRPARARRASPSGRGRRRRPCRPRPSTTHARRCVGGHARRARPAAREHASDSALKACGRFSVSVTTPRASFSRSTRAVGSDMSASPHSIAEALLRALAQLELLDLAGGGLGDRLEADLARHLVAGQQRLAVRDQLGRRDARAGLESRRRPAASRPTSGRASPPPRRPSPPGGGTARLRPRSS